MKHTRYLLYIKIDHAPLIILIFLFETFKNYYFLNSSIPLLRGCLHKIPFQAKWSIFISVSGQFLPTVYMIQPEMKLVVGVN